LKEPILHALENDNALSDIAPTFVKGYIRAYAKILELDGEKLVEQYNSAHADDAQYNAPMISFSRKVARENVDSRWMLVTYGVIAILVFLIITWWYQQTQTNTLVVVPSNPTVQEPPASVTPSDSVKPSTEQEPSVIENPLEESPAVESISSEGPSTLQSNEIVGEPNASEFISDASEDAEQPQVVPDITTVIAALENADPDLDEPLLADVSNEPEADVENTTIEIVFTFAEDCWIKITDATGNDIAYGVKKAGRVMPVSGVAPFSVVLGAPAGVVISYDGTPVDLSRFPDNRTARFSLPLEAQ
jgi:cytoskeleton protein RodZ